MLDSLSVNKRAALLSIVMLVVGLLIWEPPFRHSRPSASLQNMNG